MNDERNSRLKNLISENTNREMDHDECAKFTQKMSLPLAGLLPKWLNWTPTCALPDFGHGEGSH